MRRVTDIAARGAWPEPEASASVTLDFDTRCRRRIRIDTDDGEPFLLDRAEPGVLREGDGLLLDDGRWLRVQARVEALVAIDAADAQRLLRLAWHLGNRHLPTEIDGNTLYIHRDHVIEDMLRGLGAHLQAVMRPFNPEGGAYDGHTQGHHHHHAVAGHGAPRPNGKDHGA